MMWKETVNPNWILASSSALMFLLDRPSAAWPTPVLDLLPGIGHDIHGIHTHRRGLADLFDQAFSALQMPCSLDSRSSGDLRRFSWPSPAVSRGGTIPVVGWFSEYAHAQFPLCLSRSCSDRDSGSSDSRECRAGTRKRCVLHDRYAPLGSELERLSLDLHERRA